MEKGLSEGGESLLIGACCGGGSEMFLGPAHKDFKFAPKHKSNSYEIEAEG